MRKTSKWVAAYKRPSVLRPVVAIPTVAKHLAGVRTPAEYRVWLVAEIAKLDAAVAASGADPTQQEAMRQESAAKTKELGQLAK